MKDHSNDWLKEESDESVRISQLEDQIRDLEGRILSLEHIVDRIAGHDTVSE